MPLNSVSDKEKQPFSSRCIHPVTAVCIVKTIDDIAAKVRPDRTR